MFYDSFCDSYVYCKVDPWGGFPSFWSSRSALAERNELRQVGDDAIMGRPSGMRGGGGKGYGEGLRSLQGVVLCFCRLVCKIPHASACLRQGRRIATRILPGRTPISAFLGPPEYQNLLIVCLTCLADVLFVCLPCLSRSSVETMCPIRVQI